MTLLSALALPIPVSAAAGPAANPAVVMFYDGNASLLAQGSGIFTASKQVLVSRYLLNGAQRAEVKTAGFSRSTGKIYLLSFRTGGEEVRLQNKVVVITGSTRGIGRAIAEACAAEGATVVVSSRTDTAVRAAIGDLRKKGWSVSGVAADVSRQEDLESLLKHAVDTWGRVDVWVNNAGLSSGLRPLDEMEPEEIRTIVNVNVIGTILGSRLVIPYLIKQGGGILVNMSGKGGRGEASPFTATYAATKAAVTSITKSLALEYKGYPVSIHGLLPGMVATDFYKEENMKASPKLAASKASMPYVMKAVGVPAEQVGRYFVERIASQEPGKVTGKMYSLLSGGRMFKAIGLLMWYRATGKLQSER